MRDTIDAEHRRFCATIQTQLSFRLHKEHSIPETLWKKIFSLAKIHSLTKIRSLFGMSSQQYQNKLNQYDTPPDASPLAKTDVVLNNWKGTFLAY